MSDYPYTRGNRLEDRNRYSYSSFGGEAFLAAWREERERVLRALPAAAPAPAPRGAAAPETAGGPTGPLIEWLLGTVASTPRPQAFDLLVQRFEVTGRLHRDYNERWRAADRALYRELGLYVRFAELLHAAYRATGELPYLSTLLKCMDTLCSIHSELGAGEQARLATLIAAERRHVETLPHVAPIRKTEADDEAGAGGELERTVFLAAPTPRSLAYARELATRGLRPERVMVLGGEGEDARALLDVCAKEDWEVEVIAAGDVNDPAVVARLAELRPRMVVYSGFGGQIVAPETLATAEGFLHSHSGWLPHERGSTTLYYGLLRDGRCAVSVFLLAPEIDAGGILARRRYAAPTAGADVDREYDAAIRADLLGRVLSVYAASRRLPPPLAAESSAAPMHYVIHPVLKHLAQLRLGSGAPPCPENSHVLHS